MNSAVDLGRSPASPELHPSPTADQFRDQATRYHVLAERTTCPARQDLYRRLERNYLTLAHCQDILGRPAKQLR
jgi:hypothetical protein